MKTYPQEAKEGTDTERRDECVNYMQCLNYAAHRGWNNYECPGQCVGYTYSDQYRDDIVTGALLKEDKLIEPETIPGDFGYYFGKQLNAKYKELVKSGKISIADKNPNVRFFAREHWGSS